MTCRAIAGDGDRPIRAVTWLHDDAPVVDSSTVDGDGDDGDDDDDDAVTVDSRWTLDGATATTVVLRRVARRHAGVWRCLVETAAGNASSTRVNIVVVAADTTFCPPTVTETVDRGRYAWPKTVAGVTGDVACSTGPASDYAGATPARAYHRCDGRGRWTSLDVDDCQYADDFTRFLAETLKVRFCDERL